MDASNESLSRASLEWLADAPLFIDEDQTRGFYDAVVRPEGQHGKLTLSLKSLEGRATTVGADARAELGVAEWLTSLFPFLKAGLEAGVSGEIGTEKSEEEARSLELLPIDTPQRQLVQLALHYVFNQARRIAIVANAFEHDWQALAHHEGSPRLLVFADFPPRTKFMPMAVEVSDGKVEEVWTRLGAALGKAPREYPPEAPDHRLIPSDDNAKRWAEYWQWYEAHFSHRIANKVVEDTVAKGGGRVRWIAYRVPLANADRPLHLQLSGRERYDTGVFAYDLIQRGYSHGLRMVGTLRPGPALKVLAVFDR